MKRTAQPLLQLTSAASKPRSADLKVGGCTPELLSPALQDPQRLRRALEVPQRLRLALHVRQRMHAKPACRRSEIVRFHKAKQSCAWPVLSEFGQHRVRFRQEQPCHLPLALRIILVAHVESMSKLGRVASAHRLDARIRIESVGHVP